MRLLLLMPKTTYRADDFLAAADVLGASVVVGSDRCRTLESKGVVRLTRESIIVDLNDPAASVLKIVEQARQQAFDGIVAVDDAGTVLAARACQALGLPHNDPAGAGAARDKLDLRRRLTHAGIPQPRFRLVADDADPTAAVATLAHDPGFPLVLKPRFLSGSRGVIRADDQAAATAALTRIGDVLHEPAVRAIAGDATGVLIESFIPGPEVALEGLLTDGRLETLALFDKPDPLDGPYFEETIYVTPSRLSASDQGAVEAAVQSAADALGLRHGPVHAELRINAGTPTVIEVAARSIGGLCGRMLQVGLGMSLEEVIIRHAVGLPYARRHTGATGALMIPIPRSGVFRGVQGLDEASAVEGITGFEITARPGREIRALPEGDNYLGFGFAKAETPADVERILRQAQACLQPDIRAKLPLVD